MTDNQDALPRLTLIEKDLLQRLLKTGQQILWQHPLAARTILQALVAEGRRFSQTASGQDWQKKLASTELIKRGRLIWQAYGLDTLLVEESTIVPSEWLEKLLAELGAADLEKLLSTLMVEGVQHGDFIDPARSNQ